MAKLKVLLQITYRSLPHHGAHNVYYVKLYIYTLMQRIVPCATYTGFTADIAHNYAATS